VDTIKVLALSLGIFSQYRRRGLFSVEELQSHSLRTAALAKHIATHERLPKVEVEEVFLAAMMHDVGKLVLALNCHPDYEDCIALARARNLPIFEAESEMFGLTHAEVGMYLLRLWGLPDSVAEAVAFHHRPAASGVRVLGSLAIVHAADVLTREEDRLPSRGLDVAWMSGLNKAPRVDEWRSLSTGAIKGAA
jgi:putative nucleotidyltransferase with HDIG domain